MHAPGPDFGVLAHRYDDLRPADANWWEVFDALVADGELLGRRVLDVGCGTGRFAHELSGRGARVWGVDPSDEMLAEARARGPLPGGGFKRASAERLPFRAGWFDRVVFRQSAHLVDRPAAYAEAARVLDRRGRVALATFHPDHFETVWVARLFPRVAEIDRGRFPTPAELSAELAAAGFADPVLRRLVQDAPLAREDALERIRGRFISTLQLLDEAEVEEGLARAERDLPAELESKLDWLIVTADLP